MRKMHMIFFFLTLNSLVCEFILENAEGKRPFCLKQPSSSMQIFNTEHQNW